jgi:DNA-binding CsgD family transcriptional regulator/tetratricopeptide (TPR) repeat protein
VQLLEREQPLQMLDAALENIEQGSGRLALVAGEAGIGKTTLVEHFAVLHRTRAQTFWGACDALFTPRPLGPLRDIALQAGDPLRRELDASRDRHELFSVLLRYLRDREQPLIVVIEDVHWADEATLDLVKFLGRRVSRVRALIILTYRDDEVDAAHPLRSVLGELPRDTTVRVHLELLSPNAVDALARAMRHPVPHRNLHEATGGNPFFVTEILASGNDGVPATVRDAVLARASRLSPSAREAIDVVSLSPIAVEPWLIDACLPGFATAIDECIGRGMLRAAGVGYTFRHELARLAVRESLTPQRRLELDRRLLAALRSRPVVPEMLSRLAHHADAAGDQDAVLEYAQAAARRATLLGAHREAFAHYSRALRYADVLPDAERARLHEAYAKECHSVGDMERAIAARRAAVDIWRRLGEPLKQGENLCRLMVSYIGGGCHDAEAKVVTQAAIELLEPLGPSAQLALAYRTRAALHMFQRDNADAIAWGERAVALAREFDDRETLISSLNVIGSAMLLAGDEANGIRHLEQSLELSREAGLEEHVLNAYGNLGSACGEVHRFALADRYLAAGIEYALERDRDHSRLYAMSWQALTHLHQGRWNQAADTALAVLRSPTVASISRIMALLALGRLRTRRGDPGAMEALDEARELAARTGTLQRLGPVAGARAEAAWLAGDRDRTIAEARSAYDLARAKRHPWFVGELAYWQWIAGALDAPPAESAEPFRLQIEGHSLDAAAAWRVLNCPFEAARALAESDDEDAQKQALQEFEQLGARPAAEVVRQRLRKRGARGIPRGPRPDTRANVFGLTAREFEIVGLLAQRMTNAEMAKHLHRSEKTVGHHVSAVLAKLGVHSREAAVAAAHAQGLLQK